MDIGDLLLHDSVIDDVSFENNNLHITASYATLSDGSQISADIDIIGISNFCRNGDKFDLKNHSPPEFYYKFDDGQIYDFSKTENKYELVIIWENYEEKNQETINYNFEASTIKIEKIRPK
jgi:hypothetical protein